MNSVHERPFEIVSLLDRWGFRYKLVDLEWYAQDSLWPCTGFGRSQAEAYDMYLNEMCLLYARFLEGKYLVENPKQLGELDALERFVLGE